MPFTPSHAVVALAFVRTPLVPAAIAIGAMTPDLPIFVRVGIPSYAQTHDMVWLPVTLLVAFALFLVWRLVLRPAARELSPTWLADRLPPSWDGGTSRTLRETFPSPAGTLLLVVSLLLGVASHIVWDLFTHAGRWGAVTVPGLSDMWGSLHGYRWVQHGSTVLGLAIIAVWAIVWMARRSPVSFERMLSPWVRVAWWLSLPVVLAIASVIGLTARPLSGWWTVAHFAYKYLPPACAVWGAITLALCVVVLTLRAVRSGRGTDSARAEADVPDERRGVSSAAAAARRRRR